jgi:hypothetical protein
MSGVRKGNAGGGSPLAVVVGDDLNMTVSPDTDAAVWGGRENGIPGGVNLRVGGAQIDADGWAGHYFRGFRGGGWLGRMLVGFTCTSGDGRGPQRPTILRCPRKVT